MIDPAVAGSVKVHAADWPDCRSFFWPKNVTETSVYTVAETLPTSGIEMPPLFWAGILLTKVICAALVDALHRAA